MIRAWRVQRVKNANVQKLAQITQITTLYFCKKKKLEYFLLKDVAYHGNMVPTILGMLTYHKLGKPHNYNL